MMFYFRHFFYDFNPCVIKRVPKKKKSLEFQKEIFKAMSSKIEALAQDIWMIKHDQNDRRNEDEFTTLRF